MNKKIKTSINFFIRNFIIIMSFFMTLPFLLISYFNNPSSDDYCFASLINKNGYWQTQILIYKEWTGRFISTAILSLDIMEENNLYLYKLFPVILFVLLFLSIFLLINLFFKVKSLNFNIEISVLLFLLYILQVPIISEGFYWWAGAITYQLANILTVLFISNLIVVFRKKSNLSTIVASLLGFTAVACNETSLMLINTFMALVLFFNYYLNKKNNIRLLIIFIFCLISALIVALAPGNTVRSSLFLDNNHSLFFSIIMSFFDFLRLSFRWIGLSFLISLLIYSKIKANKWKSNDAFFNKIRIIPFKTICLIVFFTILSSLFIGFWTMGKPIPVRATNSVYLFFIISICFIFIELFRRMKIENTNLFLIKHLDTILSSIIISIMLNNSNMINVIDDLARFRVVKYKNQNAERLLLSKSSEKNIDFYVKPIENFPKTIFVNDFKSDKNYFVNKCYAKYWGFKSVKLKCDE